MSLKDLILAAPDLPLNPIEVGEWGVTAFVRQFTGFEREELVGLLASTPQGEVAPPTFAARVVALGLCDDAGTRVFAMDDAAALGGKNGRVVERVASEILLVNGIGTVAEADMGKDSAPTPSSSTTTSSPSASA